MRSLLVPLMAVVILAGACGDSSSPSAPTQATLMGTWQATRAEYVSRTNSAARVDVVARGGSMLLTLASGDFTLAITDPGKPATTLSGSWSASKEVLRMSPSGVTWSWEFDMTLSANTLTLNNGGALYDVTGDGGVDEVTLNLTLVRR